MGAGQRYLAPTAQGTGDGLTFANAAAAANRLTHEAALHAAAVADGALKAAGTPSDVAIELRWRADLGPYNLSTSTMYAPNALHGGVSATRKLRHISVDASDVKVVAAVSRNHTTKVTTHTGEASVVQFVGTRTADPRTSPQKTSHAVNISPVARYVTTLDDSLESLLQPGEIMNLTTAVVTNPGTGVWSWGNNFEVASGNYSHVLWDGFKWKNWQIPFSWSGGSQCSDIDVKNCYVENVKNLCRNSSAASLSDLVFDGIYARGIGQTFFRIDYGDDCRFANLDLDFQFQVGDRIVNATTFGIKQATPTMSNPVVEDFLIANCWDGTVTSRQFRQGEGIDAEDSCANLTVRRGVIDTCGDACIDVKVGSADPTVPALTIQEVDCYRSANTSLKLWGGRDNGLYNLRYLEDVRSFYPLIGHMQLMGDDYEWVNPAGGTAMTDFPGRATTVIDAQDTPLGHLLVTLRDLILSRDAGSPTVRNHDNTATYPTTADADAAGVFQVRIQEVSGAGFAGTVTVDGVTYDGSTLTPDESVTNRVHITGTVDEVTFTLLPSSAGELTPVDSSTVDVTWNDTDTG